jgi:WD40 repeat protein
VSLWNGALQHLFGATPSESVHAIASSPDGKHLAAGITGRTLLVWDTTKSDAPMKLNLGPGSGAILSAAYSPDGKRIAAGAEGSGEIGVWDASSGQLLGLLKGHSASVEALNFSPDGSRIVSGSRDKSIRVWDAATYDPLLVLGDHDEAIASLGFSTDGARIYSASSDGIVRIWETK